MLGYQSINMSVVVCDIQILHGLIQLISLSKNMKIHITLLTTCIVGGLKEATYIRTHKSDLNHDQGQHTLSVVYPPSANI